MSGVLVPSQGHDLHPPRPSSLKIKRLPARRKAWMLMPANSFSCESICRADCATSSEREAGSY